MSILKKIVKTLVGKSDIEADEIDLNELPAMKESLAKGQANDPQRNKGKRNDRNKDNTARNNRGRNNQNKKAAETDSGTRSNQRQNSKPRPKKTGDSSTRPQRSPNSKAAKSAIDPHKVVDPLGFRGLGLREEILKAVGEQGYANPTPIQAAAIKDLCQGRDLLGCAQTGTGKTAAFALPTLQLLSESASARHDLKVLALAPTRELALQVSESYQDYGRHLNLTTAVIFGGVGAEPQKRALKRGIDILVATPGRLLDLHGQGFVNFNNIEILILDEADRMLDMGFLPDVKRIIKLLPAKRQNILFSATMPKEVEELTKKILHDPVKVEVAPVSSTSERVEQTIFLINREKKRDLLLHLLEDPETYKVLVFTRTKAIANRIAQFLSKQKISAAAIHGNKSQSARQRALDDFKGEKIRVLVATDLAARGLDVDDITHVINFDLPNIAETYVHRIGRTGRAQANGKAISFCDGAERAYLRDIEKITNQTLPLLEDHPFPFQEGIDPPIVQGGGQRSKRPPHRGNSRPARGGQGRGSNGPKKPRRSGPQR